MTSPIKTVISRETCGDRLKCRIILFFLNGGNHEKKFDACLVFEISSVCLTMQQNKLRITIRILKLFLLNQFNKYDF